MTSGPLRVVVAGGGPAGLFTAWKLVELGHHVTVLERESRVGGLAATVQRESNALSFGTHHLHSPDPQLIAPFRELVGSELIELDRCLEIKFMGGFYPYPLNTRDLIRGLPLPLLVASAASLAKSMVARRLRPRDPADAEEAVIQLYGQRLYEVMFRDYTTRFWGIPPSGISATFVRARMPGISPVEGVKKWLAKVGLIGRASLGQTVQIGSGKMYTTRTGVGRVFEAMADAIRAGGGSVRTSSEVERVHCAGDMVRAVTSRGDVTTPCDLFVSTMPVHHLVRRMDPQLPLPLLGAADTLGHRALVVAAFVVWPKRLLGAMFTYFPDRTFHRLAELRDPPWGVEPRGASILLAEMTCDVTDELWRDPTTLTETLIADLVAEGLVDPDGVMETHYLKVTEAYPKYFLGFEAGLGAIEDHLETVGNLVSTGRHGAYQFTSMVPTMMGAWSETQKAIEKLSGATAASSTQAS